MSTLFSLITPVDFALVCLVAIVAGVIKGMVGFAMPMIMISGLGMILPPELALAGLILPTVAANGFQALAQGWRAALESVKRFRIFLIVGFVFLVSSAQLVRVLPASTLLLMLGVPVTCFALIQLLGVKLKLSSPNAMVEAAVSAVAGFIGGLSGVWGPPTVMYLTALDTPKTEQVRVQGVIYGLGAVALLGAHIGSGVLNRDTAPFSLVLILPALLGVAIGARLHDRIDQVTFRRATLAVLLVAGLNLVRRALVI